MIKAFYLHRFNANAWKEVQSSVSGFQVAQIITNLFGCQEQTLQLLIGCLQLSFVPILGAEMDNLLPRQALFGKQLLSLLSFHLNTRTNALVTQQHPLTWAESSVGMATPSTRRPRSSQQQLF